MPRIVESLFSLPLLSAARRSGYAAVATVLYIGCGSSVADVFPGAAAAPPDTGVIRVSVDAAETFPISRFIYGGNFIDWESTSFGDAKAPREMTLNRMGGNRMSAYNWENNYSNAGNDYEYHNDQYLSESTTPGEAVRVRAADAFGKGQAFMATIPMLGWVAGDACGCNVGITDKDRAQRMAKHFKVSKAVKGSPFTPVVTNDSVVYQDEFVDWFERTFPGRSRHPTAPVFFSLDNEPDSWHGTHKEIQSDIGDNQSTPRIQTYAGMVDTSIVYARAVKGVLPDALVFGPAVATYAGLVTIGRYPTPDPVYGSQNFTEVYLDRMRAAEQKYGRRLLDVFDTHWYPELGTRNGTVTNDYAAQDSLMIWKRVQAPRSLWDPTFDEDSWVSGVTNGPIALIPRLKAQIAAHYPGTKLAITEYSYGRGGDISGGVAQSDVLGIFGREGVFAAALWPHISIWAEPYKGDASKAYAYSFGAFRMYRNYDGSGGAFGDIGLRVRNPNPVSSSLYASRDSAGRIVMVAINKTGQSREMSITISGLTRIGSVNVYRMQQGSPNPSKQADLPPQTGSVVRYAMPALSVTTLVVTP